ncbi:TIGR03086 family metal-binding protein [Granulicoccus phenolivorans]|uniref:TIGR03086 family metal-binding protein n=1 Tax=Granulicoccus phenolivorans TaxID=266854 RepID=UPI0003F527E0|nr:TIGR03086 family metal-binding protein [Granulicoccus phenolivorans]
MDTSTTHHTTQSLARVVADLADVLDGIGPEQSTDPTPCTEFTVAELRGHVVGWLTAFTDGFSDPAGRCSDAAAVSVRGTGGPQVRELLPRLVAGLNDGGLERDMYIGEAGLPGELAASMTLLEYQIHGWDLAAATGQPWQPEESGLLASLAFAPPMLTPDQVGPGKSFALPVEVAADAPALDRLLALTGRDPQWSRPR